LSHTLEAEVLTLWAARLAANAAMISQREWRGGFSFSLK